ncbi:MAG TPA: serine protease [Paraburkholderia sp.]|uniref:S1 family peptidase n=1 Tax=Paraburkholderia sp. TaxID=1926495 RepID=UPI002CC549F2|nr:serine protease [Paraburkholderia sp.]HTR07336.1 serine protease [Paraburkholderia sp.]
MGTIELYCSPNGDRWLFCDSAYQAAFIRHVPNAASGGSVTDVAVEAFLAAGKSGQRGPQYDALQELLTRTESGDVSRDAAPSSPPASAAGIVHKPAAEALLLSAARVRTFAQRRHMTNASGFFFTRDDRLFLVTSRHVLIDSPSQHFPDRIEVELHVDRDNLGASTWFSLPLYSGGTSLWRQASDDGGDVDVAVLEVRKDRLPAGAVFEAFGPEHLPTPGLTMPAGASVLIVGFPLGFHDSLHHLPIVRQGAIASAFGLRFDGKGCFITDARTHRGTSGAPVVASTASMHAHGVASSLPWILLGIHSSTVDMGARDRDVDESLGLNQAWYADVLMTLTAN